MLYVVCSKNYESLLGGDPCLSDIFATTKVGFTGLLVGVIRT